MMGGVSPETCWAIKKHCNNKFYYTVASCWFFLWEELLSCSQNLISSVSTWSLNPIQRWTEGGTLSWTLKCVSQYHICIWKIGLQKYSTVWIYVLYCPVNGRLSKLGVRLRSLWHSPKSYCAEQIGTNILAYKHKFVACFLLGNSPASEF